MFLAAVAFLIFVLYLQTVHYNYLIDDNVKRDGYLYDVPEVSPHPDFYKTKPSVWYRLFMISMHAVNSVLVGVLFNPTAGLLFAVHPVCVNGTAWVTGNYYATTAYFFLIALYFLIKVGGMVGALISTVLMATALNSTVTAIAMPIVATIAVPLGWLWLWPLVAFLGGKRFRYGIRLRKERANKTLKISDKFTWRRLVVMVKVVAFYIKLAFFPYRLSFFKPLGDCYLRRNEEEVTKLEEMNEDFWISFGICWALWIIGFMISPLATLIFFGGIGAFSQFKFLGQFVAERYLYLPLIGICALVGEVVAAYPVIVAVISTALVYRTLQYIPAWKDMRAFYEHDVQAYPEYGMALSNLAQHIIFGGIEDVNRAYTLLLKAERVSKPCYELKANMAVVLIRLQQWKAAYTYTVEAMKYAEGKVNEIVWKTLVDQKAWIEKHKLGADSGVELAKSNV